MSNPNWEPCPRCGSNRTTTLGRWLPGCLIIGGGGLLSLVIGIFFWPVLLLSPLIIIGGIVGGILNRPRMFCRDCNHSWDLKHTQ